MLSPITNYKKTVFALGLALSLLFLAGCKKQPVHIVASITQPVISAGENNCEVNTAGRVLCWSDNDNGLEGRAVNQASMDIVHIVEQGATQATPMANAIAVDIGVNSGCALRSINNASARTVACWEVSVIPHLAQTLTVWERSIRSGNVVQQVTVGENHVCALLKNGEVECIGDNNLGQLGDGTINPNSFSNVQGLGLAAKFISAGDNYTCVLLSDNTVKCWGDNSAGQLAYDTLNDTGLTYSALPVTAQSVTGVSTISAGSNYSCALLVDRSLQCWGSNTKGQLGDGNLTSISAPVGVLGINNAKLVSAGSEHTCAVLLDNTVKCWGANDEGQLGNLEQVDSLTPVDILVEGVNNNLRSISVGNKHSCALRNDNTVKCWGGVEPVTP